MCEFTLRMLEKKKGKIQAFLIVCSLYLSVNAFSWGKSCCRVTYMPPCKNINDYRIKLEFNFFDSDTPLPDVTSFLKNMDVYYSTNECKSFNALMSAFTKKQKQNPWACLLLSNKEPGAKIFLFYHDHSSNNYVTEYWKDHSIPKLSVKNHFIHRNQIWMTLFWHLKKDIVTHIQVVANWNQGFGSKPIQIHDLLYRLTLEAPQLKVKNTNLSDSSFKQKIKTEYKMNQAKVFKEANAIVINGAFRDKIQVYTTASKLVKSTVANNNILKIVLSEKQDYIVNVGQVSYKIAM